VSNAHNLVTPAKRCCPSLPGRPGSTAQSADAGILLPRRPASDHLAIFPMNAAEQVVRVAELLGLQTRLSCRFEVDAVRRGLRCSRQEDDQVLQLAFWGVDLGKLHLFAFFALYCNLAPSAVGANRKHAYRLENFIGFVPKKDLLQTSCPFWTFHA
jgi:hypothetical protein